MRKATASAFRKGLRLNSTRITKRQFSGSLVVRSLTFRLEGPIDREAPCVLLLQFTSSARLNRSGHSTDAGLRTSRGYRACIGHRFGHLGRSVQGRPGLADSNSPSWKAGNHRLRPLRQLRSALGRKRRILGTREARRFHSCPGFPAAYGNQPLETGAVSMGRRSQYSNAHRHQPVGRHLVVSRASCCRQLSPKLGTRSSHGRG